MARLSRKELKKDEIRETLAHGAEAITSHRRLVYSLGIPALVVLLGIIGWKYYQQRQSAQASVALADAMVAYDAPVATPGQVLPPGLPNYPNEQAKFEDANRKLMEVANRYPRVAPGEMARYYAAISLERLGRYPDAEKSLEQLQSAHPESIRDLARFALAQLYDQMGKGSMALPIYQQLEAKPSPLVPKPVVLLALGDHYLKTDPKQAAKYYNEVKSEFSGTGMADVADKRLQMLGGKT